MTGRNPNVENSRGNYATKLHQLDLDGLPFVGAYLEDGDALFRSDTAFITHVHYVWQNVSYKPGLEYKLGL